MSKNKVDCVKISVDCTENDPVDIKAGGPEILGYDFFVRESEAEEKMAFIRAVISELNIPLKSVYIAEFIQLSEDQLWSNERIRASIQRDAQMLIEESQRYYSSTYHK